MTVGERIRTLRLERGLAQRDFTGSGVSPAYISYVERGQRQPSVKALRVIARVLGTTAEFLETGNIRPMDALMMRALDLDLQMRLAEHGGGLDLESEFRSLFRDAIATGDRGVATRAKIALGLITHADRRPGEAITHFARAIEDNTVTPVTHPEVYLKLAEAHFDSGNSVSAVSVLEDAIGFIERSGDDRLFVRFAASLTSVLADAGQWERAEHLAERARNVNVDDIRIRARLIWASGHLAAAQGRPDQGIDLMQRAIALLSATEDTIGTGRAHLFCSALSLDAGQVEKAKEHLDRAGRLLGAGAGGEVEDAITALGRRAQFAQEPTHAISAAESHDTHHL